MGTLLITLAFVTILVVTGLIVNMHLYNPGAKRFKQSRSIRPTARRYTTSTGMSDAEYFTRLNTIEEDGPRYARRAVTMLSFVVILIIIVVISLLSSPH
jgi:ABC-type uncharacterized transport system permease subunit